MFIAKRANNIDNLVIKKTGINRRQLFKRIIKSYELYILLIPACLYYIIFYYWPMYGVQIAFKDFIPSLGIAGSPWAGFTHFERFFSSYHFLRLIRNTLGISLYSLAVNFPVPIILALMINEVGNKKFKRLIQTVTYAPYFISTVVLVGMIAIFLSPSVGIINRIIMLLGGEAINFMQEPKYFRTIYVLTGVWQHAGWNSVIYLASLSGIDTQLHEAAIMDGATKLQRIRYINLPGIMPTIVVLLILNAGRVMSVGFEKIYLMQNAINMEVSDVISTYVYRTGLLGAQYSFSSAVGLFNSVVNFILLIIVNKLAKKLGETSLW